MTYSAADELTVVMITKDRPQFVARWLKYADHIKLPFKVIIADGGKDNALFDALSGLPDRLAVNYEYIRYPYDKTHIENHTKMSGALSHVTTPFTVMADDNIFFITEGLLKSVEYLKINPDYATCRGHIDVLTLPDAHDPFCENITFIKSESYNFCSNMFESASERVKAQFSLYNITYYDVHRTPDIQVYFQILDDLKIHDAFISELLTSFLSISSGKAALQPYLYLLRQYSPEISTSAKINLKNDAFDRMLLKTWSSDFNGFVRAVAESICSRDNMAYKDAELLVKKGYRRFIAQHIVECLKGSSDAKTHLNVQDSSCPKIGFDAYYKHLMPVYETITSKTGPKRKFIETLYDLDLPDLPPLDANDLDDIVKSRETRFGSPAFLRQIYKRYLEEINGGEILIWGCGGFFRQIEEIFYDCQIHAFIDNNYETALSPVTSISVKRPNYLKQCELPVFICSNFKEDICQQIRTDYPHISIIP